jgi:RecA-family ATPase
LQQLARLLGGTVSNVQVLAPGPGHSAADRSLSVKLDKDVPDGFLVHSFANDDPIQCRDYVREKAGLPAWKPDGNGRKHASDADIDKVVMAAIIGQVGVNKPSSPVVATYDYTDEIGMLLYQVQRLEPKSFRQRRPDGNGKWIWNLDGVRRVPYRIGDMIKYPFGTVFVCEGEKDTNCLIENDLCATTVASGKWDNVDVSTLANRDVMVLEDNDAIGREKSAKAAVALHGTAATIRIVRLPGLPEHGDVSDWLDAGHSVDELVEFCFSMPLWNPISSRVSEQRPVEKNEPAAPVDTRSPPLPFINITAWHDQPVPEREWCVLDRIPLRNVTLFSGEGAIGKSIVSLHLGAAIALGRDWLGTIPEPGPALIVACEDDANELHRRLARILHHYGASFADLKDMHLLSLAGEDALLAKPDRSGLIQATKLFDRLRQAACDIHPKLIVLDNSADVFGGSENDRTQVRQFIGTLRNLAIAAGAGLLLTSHPSLTGISTGSGISGSTAWHASVRSRLYMKRAITERDEEPDPNLRVIEVMKSNYGPVGETITVRWKDGIFLPEPAPGSLEKMATEQAADDLFLRLLSRFSTQGRNVSDKPTANSYAPAAFAKEKEAHDASMKKADLEAAMRRLFTAGKIQVETYGQPSRGWTRLAII